MRVGWPPQAKPPDYSKCSRRVRDRRLGAVDHLFAWRKARSTFEKAQQGAQRRQARQQQRTRPTTSFRTAVLILGSARGGRKGGSINDLRTYPRGKRIRQYPRVVPTFLTFLPLHVP